MAKKADKPIASRSNSNLIFEIQDRINKNDIYLISSENNRKLFNIYNYSIFKINIPKEKVSEDEIWSILHAENIKRLLNKTETKIKLSK